MVATSSQPGDSSSKKEVPAKKDTLKKDTVEKKSVAPVEVKSDTLNNNVRVFLEEEIKALKNEVDTLKKKMEEMEKEIQMLKKEK